MSEQRALSGLKVLDFTRLLPGPYAGMVLADLGADVVKVEATRGGDYMRWIPPLDGRLSYSFKALNAGKRSVALDLKTPEGVAIARRMVADADILLESFRPGVMDRLGLGYEVVAGINPRLIYCAITGYGQTGPCRDRAGHDLNFQALSGVLGLAGPKDRKPALPAAQLADLGGGALFSLTGVLAALYQRERTGKGTLLDISMTDGCLAFLQMAAAAHLGGGKPMPERGTDTLTGGAACYDIYETKNGGFMALCALEPKFWLAFCKAVNRPDLVPRHFGNARQIEATRRDLEVLFRERTRDEWTLLLADHDTCCEPVLSPEEVAHHPLHIARKNVMEDADGMPMIRMPLRDPLMAAPAPAPQLGDSTADVLRELGYSSEDVQSLCEKNVILCPGN